MVDYEFLQAVVFGTELIVEAGLETVLLASAVASTAASGYQAYEAQEQAEEAQEAREKARKRREKARERQEEKIDAAKERQQRREAEDQRSLARRANAQGRQLLLSSEDEGSSVTGEGTTSTLG